MLLGVWQALNSLSIHVTFTAIVSGAYPGRPKCAKNVLKWRPFELTAWITGKRLKIDGYILLGVWQALNSLSIHVTFTAIVPGAYPGEAKMCLRLSWRSQIAAPATAEGNDIPAWLSWGSQIMCLRLIAETDARSVSDSHLSCWYGCCATDGGCTDWRSQQGWCLKASVARLFGC